MRKAGRIIMFTFLGLVACKKNYTCECKNANGVYVAGEVDATQSKAKKHCEGLSGSSTECYVK